MTFAEIVTLVAEQVNVTTSDGIARIGKHVNRRYRRVMSSIGLAPMFTRTQIAFQVTAGTRTQTIGGIEKVLTIALQGDATTVYPLLEEITYDEMLRVVPSTGRPYRYATKLWLVDSVVVVFDSLFDDPIYLSVEGEAKTTDLAGTQEPAFPEAWHDVLAYGALEDELRKKEKVPLARDAAMDYERMLGALRLHIAASAMLDFVQGKENVRSSFAARTTV